MANILYAGFFALPDKDAAANRVMNNAKAFRDAGNTVFFLDEQNKPIENEHSVAGFKTWSIERPTNFFGLLKKMTSIKNIVNLVNTVNNIDIIIVYNYPAIAMLKLMFYCKTSKIKLVSDCTEWYSGKDYSFPMNILSAGDSLLRMSYVQKKLDGIIGISSYLCDYYSKCKNVIFVPPLVDKCEFIWNQDKLEYNPNKLNLVYTGNLGKSKEVFLPIIDGIINSKNKENIVLRIVGATKDQFIELCPNAEEKIKILGNSLIFLGRITHAESLKVLVSSDYLIFFRENNRVTKAGFSTKFVEAISSRTKVITTDTGDIKYYINNINCGYIVEDYHSLSILLDKDINELKQKNELYDTNIFDYKNYVEEFSKWIGCVLKQN